MAAEVWLSGSSGFIGSYLMLKLRDLGISHLCVSNSRTCAQQAQFVDFSCETSIKRLLGRFGVPETFIHLGWGG